MLGALAIMVPARARRQQEQVIRVRARRFVFDPSEIRLARGVPVTFEFTSLDVPMGFNLPDFNVRSDIMPGATTSLRFTPDKAGEFSFHCDIFCGSGHETMAGTLIVS
nr:cupredoxin domain-containing protein [Massilia terrae]